MNGLVINRTQGVILGTSRQGSFGITSKPKVQKEPVAIHPHDMPMEVTFLGKAKHLTATQYKKWAEGLRIVRNHGIKGASRFSFNQMKDAMFSCGYYDQQNW